MFNVPLFWLQRLLPLSIPSCDPVCIPLILVRVSNAAKKHHAQKHLGKERVSLTLHIQTHCILREAKAGIQSGNLGAGADEETMEGCCLLTCSSCLAQPAFLKKPGLSAQEWHHPQWTGTTTTPHQSLLKKMPCRLPYSQVLQRHFLHRGPSAQITLASVELTENQKAHISVTKSTIIVVYYFF